jgi:hypothetical protein
VKKRSPSKNDVTPDASEKNGEAEAQKEKNGEFVSAGTFTTYDASRISSRPAITADTPSHCPRREDSQTGLLLSQSPSGEVLRCQPSAQDSVGQSTATCSDILPSGSPDHLGRTISRC